MKSKIYDIAIIGCGLSGASIARRLSRYDLDIACLEKEEDVSFGVSKANSGIIHAGFHHKPGTLKARLEVRGNSMYDALVKELNFPFKRVGIVVIAFSYEEMKIVSDLFEQGKKNGVNDLEIIGRERLLSLEPKINPDVVGGLLAQSGGIIEPYRLAFSLMESAVKNGVELFTGFRVTKGAYSQGTYSIRSDDSRVLIARRVVNSAGLFADRVSEAFNAEKYEIIPRKGEEFLLEKNAPGFPNHVIFPVPARNSKGVLVIPTVEGTMMLGPTAIDIEDKEDFSTTEENLEQVFNLAMKMMPVISKKDIITSFAGIRPALSGDDFYIALSEKKKHFVQVAGIQSPGLTAAPAIAEYVEGLLAQDGLVLREKEAYDPYVAKTRTLRECSHAEAERLILENPGYGNVVCRCENVSEQEIVEAVRRGHATLDGIKFFTRAGMGRCQGGFCAYKILKIIRRETGIPVTKITKRGGGSYIVSGEIGRQ